MDTALLDNYPDAMYPRARIHKKRPNGRTRELRERFLVIAERACLLWHRDWTYHRLVTIGGSIDSSKSCRPFLLPLVFEV